MIQTNSKTNAIKKIQESKLFFKAFVEGFGDQVYIKVDAGATQYCTIVDDGEIPEIHSVLPEFNEHIQNAKVLLMGTQEFVDNLERVFVFINEHLDIDHSQLMDAMQSIWNKLKPFPNNVRRRLETLNALVNAASTFKLQYTVPRRQAIDLLQNDIGFFKATMQSNGTAVPKSHSAILLRVNGPEHEYFMFKWVCDRSSEYEHQMFGGPLLDQKVRTRHKIVFKKMDDIEFFVELENCSQTVDDMLQETKYQSEPQTPKRIKNYQLAQETIKKIQDLLYPSIQKELGNARFDEIRKDAMMRSWKMAR